MLTPMISSVSVVTKTSWPYERQAYHSPILFFRRKLHHHFIGSYVVYSGYQTI